LQKSRKLGQMVGGMSKKKSQTNNDVRIRGDTEKGEAGKAL